MTDFVKGVLGGAWSLLVGWMLPVFLVLQIGMVIVAPALPYAAVESFLAQRLVDRQLVSLFIAIATGIVLSAVQTPLYRVLEGYLWPRPLRMLGRDHHVRIRAAWLRAVDEAGPVPGLRWRWTQRFSAWRRRPSERNDGASEEDCLIERSPAGETPRAPRSGLESSLLWGRVRYPADESEVAPTALGNAIRRFETYGSDRYMLDSQRLFHHLAAHAPDYIREVQSRARTNVDFFVCLVYSGLVLTLASLGVFALVSRRSSLVLAAVIGASLAVLSYLSAVVATDEWAAAIRAQVDLGRIPVAQAFGLHIPDDLDEERLMWSYVNRFTGLPYARAGSAPAWLTRFRAAEKNSTESDLDRVIHLLRAAGPGVAARSSESGDGDVDQAQEERCKDKA